MGCISSKQARSEFHDAYTVSSGSRKARRRAVTGRVANSEPLDVRAVFGPLEKIKEESEWEVEEENEEGEEEKKNDGYSGNLKKGDHEKKGGFFNIRFGKMSEGEQVAAGWPAWLSAVAGEAIDGMLPLKTEKFERLEKIGQGTYSDVYRARDLETGKIVALKKVRFDNFQPESVRFMAREILILRKLNHPNVMKLEGIITSRVSSSIHLVFEYMEHDLAGLVSCPDIKFTDSQIKCYMLQLLRGIEHCHSHGVMHRDIKTSNILVNNEGVLKIADFGLANHFRPKNKQPLTSRVVTLWYRPPELLLGSTNYGEAVDLWSVGCVFAELFIGRPVLKGRTEVEQLHKIFKLCGSPSDEYWKKCRLPLASMFKPQQAYESSLRERCKELPKSAVQLIEMLLSFEPYDRGTASFAMTSEYFATKPYACDPSRMPKYPPNKEIDAKLRENAKRKTSSRARTGSRHTRRIRLLPESGDFLNLNPTEDATGNPQTASEYRRRMRTEARSYLGQQYDTMSQASQKTEESQVSTTLSVPAHVTASGFAWAKKQKKSDLIRRIRAQQQISRSQNRVTLGSYLEESYDSTENMQSHQPDSYDSTDIYEPQELSREYIIKKKKSRVGFSAPLVQPFPEIPQNQIGQRRELNRSRFYNDL